MTRHGQWQAMRCVKDLQHVDDEISSSTKRSNGLDDRQSHEKQVTISCTQSTFLHVRLIQKNLSPSHNFSAILSSIFANQAIALLHRTHLSISSLFQFPSNSFPLYLLLHHEPPKLHRSFGQQHELLFGPTAKQFQPIGDSSGREYPKRPCRCCGSLPKATSVSNSLLRTRCPTILSFFFISWWWMAGGDCSLSRVHTLRPATHSLPSSV